MKPINILFILLFSLTSCMNLLETEPQGQVSHEQLLEMVKKDPEKVLGPMLASTVGNIHKYTRDNVVTSKGFKGYNLALDMMGNDMVLLGANSWYNSDYRMNAYREESYARSADFWSFYYKLVYQSNQILDLIPKDFSNEQLKVYEASALTIRSMAYYYLMSLYQDDYLHGGKDKAGVPLYTSATDGAKGRAPASEVWSRIRTDLNKAVGLFEEAAYDYKASKTDIDITVTHVVLARVALTMGDWTQAAASAKFVTECYPELMDEAAYTTKGFQSLELPEVILGYKYDASNANDPSFATFMSVKGLGYGGLLGEWKAIDQRLYDRIGDNDYRKKNFLAAPTDYTYQEGTKDESTQTFPTWTNMKFAVEDVKQDEIFMRVSEMYLVKAEAEARGGDENTARTTLGDFVRHRNPDYQTPALSGDALLEEIMLQKRIELWGEGFEFFDNKRMNKGVDRRDSQNHTEKITVEAGIPFTFQIPLSVELESNPYITEQNP